MNARYFAVLALTPFVCHCDPALEIRGAVVRPDDVAVENATVRTVCPPEDSTYGDVSTATNADGIFQGDGLGTVDEECSLEVLPRGEPTHRFRALDFCVEKDDSSCQHIEAHLTIPYPDPE